MEVGRCEMVSIIIPSHNYSKYIGHAIRSCLTQTYKDVEVIVVDDCSIDGTAQMVSALYPQVKLHELKTHPTGRSWGVSVARNWGLKNATGDYICFLDADDCLAPDSVRRRLEYLKEHENVDVVWGIALEIRGDISYEDAVQKMNKLRKHPSKLNSQTPMYRRRVFKKCGGFFEGLRSKEDKAFYWRLGIHPESTLPSLVKGKRIKVPLAFYRKHGNGKHQRRKANPVWRAETEMVFKKRMKQLKHEGVTRENTCFPI